MIPEVIVWFGLLAIKILNVILVPFFSSRCKEKKLQVPPLRERLLLISANKLSKMILLQEVKSEDVTKAYIKRIRTVNPIIHAVMEERFYMALEEAKSVDLHLQSEDVNVEELIRDKPLYGVPLTVKESCSVKGMSLTGASLSRTGHRCLEDGEAVKKLKEAGAIILLVSNTPELCIGWEASNYLVGRTKNPYDTRRSAGGSSGGEVSKGGT